MNISANLDYGDLTWLLKTLALRSPTFGVSHLIRAGARHPRCSVPRQYVAFQAARFGWALLTAFGMGGLRVRRRDCISGVCTPLGFFSTSFDLHSPLIVHAAVPRGPLESHAP